MSENALSLLAGFSAWRARMLPLVTSSELLRGFKKQQHVEGDISDVQALAYYEALMALPVAMKAEDGSQSLLKDMMWDFNPNHPDAARNVTGAKLRMDWSKYQDVTPSVLLEIKVAFMLYQLAPGNASSGMQKKKGKLKANSIIAVFEDGMQFVNELSGRDQADYGREFVLRNGQSIKDFDKQSYEEAAETYRFTYSPTLKTFFGIVNSHYITENVIGGYLPRVDFDKLNWKVKPKTKEQKSGAPVSSDVLPNPIFERSSYTASMLIVDFLDALTVPVVDIDTLRRRNARQFNRAASLGLSPRLMEMYTFMRLKQKGFSDDFMANVLGGLPEEFATLRPGSRATTISKPTLISLSDGRINEDLRVYLNLVNYSCCYIVAQYTGMRPSELANILLDSCLEEDGNYWLIKSRVVKHRERYGKLFDDKWVAIPIVRDAIAAAMICAKYKQSPYLFSSVDTVAPDVKHLSLNSLGIQYQLNSFFTSILSEDEALALEFSPYTLRHTLAYQMYRAEVGLPFISHQLKHFSDIVGGYDNGGYSSVTLSYGHIGDLIEVGGKQTNKSNDYRHMAEMEVVKLHYDPDGTFAGSNAADHKARNQSLFKAYGDAGYFREDIFEALVGQGIAVVNVGMGMCYGGRVEEFDDSLPCIGGLRCNPNRCSNSVITKAHAPKWRELYAQNKVLLTDPLYEDRREQINAVLEEAQGVLEYLGEDMDIDL